VVVAVTEGEKLVPVPNNVPPVAASYQLMVVPPALVADMVTVPAPHRVALTGDEGATGKGFTVTITVDVAAVHGPVPSGSFVVKVSVTFPLAMEGVYVDVSDVGLENVPLGADQVVVVALPPIVPARDTILPAQIVCAVPALTVAACVTFIVLVALTTEHGPAGSFVVNVNVTVPVKLGAGV
jgi:hypothetical protein